MLAWMRMAGLLEVEKGYAARPSPQIIDAYFWSSTELFMWVNTIRVKSVLESMPRYRVSKHNENLLNFPDYLDLLYDAKYAIGNRYKSIAEENKLRSMEMALTMLARRQDNLKKSVLSGSNNIAAKWALTITNCPKDIYDFWFGILASPSLKLTFDGVKVGERWENVTAGDLRELRDWMEDNLIGPRGEEKEVNSDDREYYFVARMYVLNIIKKHLTILEQGTAAYDLVNTAMGSNILNATDDKLEKLALEKGLPGKPDFSKAPDKITFIKEVAAWRHKTKQQLLDIDKKESLAVKKGDASYEIL